MIKNGAKIKAGIRELADKPHEIISGTVVTGSVDTTAYTMSVQPSDNSEPIEEVMLNAIAGETNGVILVPKEGSDVIIGSIDGPGEWTLINASTLARAIIKIGNVKCDIDATQVNLQNEHVFFNITDSVFKMTTASESMFQLLKDCFTYLTELTVPTPSGTSGVPVNVADFSNLLTRLNNLLEA